MLTLRHNVDRIVDDQMCFCSTEILWRQNLWCVKQHAFGAQSPKPQCRCFLMVPELRWTETSFTATILLSLAFTLKPPSGSEHGVFCQLMSVLYHLCVCVCVCVCDVQLEHVIVEFPRKDFPDERPPPFQDHFFLNLSHHHFSPLTILVIGRTWGTLQQKSIPSYFGVNEPLIKDYPLLRPFLLGVQFSSVPWLIGSWWGQSEMTQQRSSSSLCCRRPLWTVLAWAGMSTLWCYLQSGVPLKQPVLLLLPEQTGIVYHFEEMMCILGLKCVCVCGGGSDMLCAVDWESVCWLGMQSSPHSSRHDTW